VTKQEFLTLLDKYLSGTASVEEEKLLNFLLKNLEDQYQLNEAEFEALNEAEDRLFNQIKSKIQPTLNKPAKIVRLSPRIKYWAAACILLFTAFTAAILIHQLNANNHIVNNNKPEFDFKAGTNKAYLVLASGKKISLASSKPGVLATQGAVVVVRNSQGQIIYQNSAAGSGNTTVNLYNKIIVPRGGQYKIILPDGTAIWLNANSVLEYPVQFFGKSRIVKLTGEAYFEVAKNRRMPFIVNVNNQMDVKVLGTHFNIMGYDNENKITTTLIEGSVKIEDRLDAKNTALLIPGQRAEMTSDRHIKLAFADTDEATAWKDGQFIFNNESIYSITRKLSRWYNVDFVFSDKMKDKSFDGSISKYKNISEVLKLMELTKSVHFKIEERRILVMP